MSATITIRRASTDDAPAIARLAALDSRRTPTGDALLAYTDGELRAAMPFDGSPAIADPFHYTASIVELLEIRAAHMIAAPSKSRRSLRSLRLHAA